MMNWSFTFPEIGLFAATRVALGIGGLTTIPFVLGAIARKKSEVSELKPAA